MTLRESMDALVAQGDRLIDEIEKKKRPIHEYQEWFTLSGRVIEDLIPERYAEFEKFYHGKMRTGRDWTNFGIDDYLSGAIFSDSDGKPHFDHHQAAAKKVNIQLGILKAARTVFDSKLANMTGVLQATVFDSELDAARNLNDNGHVRAAGTLAGVVLEGHLKQVCEAHELQPKSANPTLSDYNGTLKEAGIIDVPRWRKNQHLGDLRNLCGHKKDREPTADDVRELIEGVSAAIKVIF